MHLQWTRHDTCALAYVCLTQKPEVMTMLHTVCIYAPAPVRPCAMMSNALCGYAVVTLT